MKDLNEIREELDVLDREIVKLLEERFELSKEVAYFKKESAKKVLDKEREEIKLAAVKALVSHEENKYFIEDLFIHIMDLSRKLQYRIISNYEDTFTNDYEIIEDIQRENIKVVYQGVPGSYSYEAMIKEFGDKVDCFNASTFKDVMLSIQKGQADYAVLPIENSSAGIVSETYDLMVDFDCFITKEINIKISHALLGLPNADISDIKTVYSHPQGLMQCKEFLEEYKNWNLIAHRNTAVSAIKVSEEKDKTQAAIASTRAASLYGLKVLKEDINFSETNTTKFVVVSKKSTVIKNANKIMLCFELPHESGSLYKILSHFIYNKVNMTKIQSRPIPDKNWEYRFFAELDGNLQDTPVKRAIYGINQEALSLKILGNY